jgi:hypothetical protein
MAPDTDDEDENDDGKVEGDKGKMPIRVTNTKNPNHFTKREGLVL